jgi:hypothetical protein
MRVLNSPPPYVGGYDCRARGLCALFSGAKMCSLLSCAPFLAVLVLAAFVR